MVVVADNYYAFVAWAFNFLHSVIGSSAFYLYVILKCFNATLIKTRGNQMKKLLIFLILVVLFLVYVVWNNTNPKLIISRLVKGGDLETGALRYRIYLLGVIPAGEVVFGIEKLERYKGQQVYHLTASGQSLSIFSKFFNSYAVLDSYIDTQKFNPVVFKQILVVKGQKSIEKEVIYDQKQGIMSISGLQRNISPNTQDPLSAIFNIRRMDFDKTKEFEVNINTNQKNYILKGTAYPKDISINNKIFKTVILGAQISRRDKNPYHKSMITMVLLKEKMNIPILIKVFASGFLINAKLIDIK